MKLKIILGLMSFVVVSSSIFVFSQESLDKSAEILRKQIEDEKARTQELENQKQKLEQLLENRKQNLQRFDQVIQNYEYNLNQTQNVINAAQQEIESIQKRRNHRELMLYRCIFSYHQNQLKSISSSFDSRLRKHVVDQAITKISNQLFHDMQAEKPRLHELQNLIQDRQAYQERILTRYMPVDLQNKEAQAAKLNEVEHQTQETIQTSKETQQRIQKLNDQLVAAENKIREIRQQQILEEKRKKEAAEQAAREQAEKVRLERLAQAEQEDKVKLTNLTQPTHPSAPTTSQSTPDTLEISQENRALLENTPFEQRKGKLMWPAKGKVVRPYGEFTHPQFGIKMINHGLDVEIDPTQTVNAAADGQVLYVGDIPGLGNSLILNHGNDYITIYANIRVSSGLQSGNIIKTGQAIGYPLTSGSNNLGKYHFEIRLGEISLNPFHWLQT